MTANRLRLTSDEAAAGAANPRWPTRFLLRNSLSTGKPQEFGFGECGATLWPVDGQPGRCPHPGEYVTRYSGQCICLEMRKGLRRPESARKQL